MWYLLAAFLAIIAYVHFKWYRILNYWSDRNISGPKPLPYVGNRLSHVLRPRPVVEMEWYKTYGRLFGLYTMLGKPALSVADPELIKQILVKDFYKFRNRKPALSTSPIFSKIMFSARDDDWKRIRAIASPTFTSAKLKHMYPLINECCRDFLAALHTDVSTGGKEVDLKQVMGAFTMDVIASCAFGTKTNTYSEPNNRFITAANHVFNQNPWKVMASMILPTFITTSWMYSVVTNARNDTTMSDVMFLINVTTQLMAERKKSGKKYNDFLQLLMDVEREDTTTDAGGDAVTERHHLIEGVDELMAEKQALSGVLEKRLTENEILAQCFLVFVAGFETTAQTLSFCTYELALNPNIQDRLVAETKEAFNENTADIDYETLCRLPLLDAVISETLRNYPPTLKLEREAMEDVVLSGGSELKIEKGVMAEIPVYAIHHDPDYYPDPFAFKPDRFLSENRHNIKPYTYLPFGSGPRNCLGMRFALLEAKLVLAKMIQQFHFYSVPNTDVPVVFNAGRDLLQAKRLVVGVEKR